MNPAVGEFPASVRDHLDGNREIVEVAAYSGKAGAPEIDAGEPAWGVMGHMIRETALSCRCFVVFS